MGRTEYLVPPLVLVFAELRLAEGAFQSGKEMRDGA